jgi:hypothetical protein
MGEDHHTGFSPGLGGNGEDELQLSPDASSLGIPLDALAKALAPALSGQLVASTAATLPAPSGGQPTAGAARASDAATEQIDDTFDMESEVQSTVSGRARDAAILRARLQLQEEKEKSASLRLQLTKAESKPPSSACSRTGRRRAPTRGAHKEMDQDALGTQTPSDRRLAQPDDALDLSGLENLAPSCGQPPAGAPRNLGLTLEEALSAGIGGRLDDAGRESIALTETNLKQHQGQLAARTFPNSPGTNPADAGAIVQSQPERDLSGVFRDVAPGAVVHGDGEHERQLVAAQQQHSAIQSDWHPAVGDHMRVQAALQAVDANLSIANEEHEEELRRLTSLLDGAVRASNAHSVTNRL